MASQPMPPARSLSVNSWFRHAVLQRLVVTVSCVGFWFLATGWPLGHGVSIGLLAFLTVLACVEKLCSIMNVVSVEKDWVRKMLSFSRGGS